MLDIRTKLLSIFLSAALLCLGFLPSISSSAQLSIGGAPAGASLGVPFKLAAGQTAQVAGSDVSVGFLNVTADSRCPSDVTCIWAGQVSVLLNLTRASGEDLGRVELTMGAGDDVSSEKKVGDYVIKLLQVDPYPVSTQEIPQSEYVVTLVLSEGKGPSLTARSALVMALASDATQNPAIALFIAGWSIERENGKAILVLRDDNNGDVSLARAVARFLPFSAECIRGPGMAECVDGQITLISGSTALREGDFIHFEIDGSKSKVYVSFKSPMTDNATISGEPAEYALDIRKFKEVLKPFVPPDDGNTTVVLTEGQREGPLLVERIFPDRIEGLNFPEYPVAMDKGLPITLRIGEKASNGCTVFLTLLKIEDGSATFLKQVDENRPCPICWYQLELMSGWP